MKLKLLPAKKFYAKIYRLIINTHSTQIMREKNTTPYLLHIRAAEGNEVIL